jgi:molybdopterin-guanine dinucleotide biosynthesis protein A
VNKKADIWGLVLAGGKSQRMGSDKALLMRDGETQLARAVALLERHVERVFVSTRSDQAEEDERKKFAQIIDRYDDMGPIAGVLSAMDEYPGVAWLVVACDLPNIDDATISDLLDGHSMRHPFTAFTSSYDGLPEPLCAIYGAGARKLVDELIAQGINCPRKMLIRSDTELLEQPHPQALDNVNTPEDLANSLNVGTR